MSESSLWAAARVRFASPGNISLPRRLSV